MDLIQRWGESDTQLITTAFQILNPPLSQDLFHCLA